MIKMEYLLEDGKEAVEGTTVIECEKCHRKFAVPGEVNLIAGKICEECASKESIEAAVEMKVEKPAELKAALGE